MSQVYVHGIGAVSPAGWGLQALRENLASQKRLPIRTLTPAGREQTIGVRRVPAPGSRPIFLGHTRLRRSSPISHFAAAAAVEALGTDAVLVSNGSLRLGIVSCVMSGCVQYSRRFYEETLRDPRTASPLVFPETVFNAPSSHLAAFFGTNALNYTLVGDPSVFGQGLAMAAAWLLHEDLDGCLVVGAEELDWVTADAFRLFSKQLILSEGAGAIYLRRIVSGNQSIELRAVTDPFPFVDQPSRARAATEVRASLQVPKAQDLLCDGLQNVPRFDRAEAHAWQKWPGARLSPKLILGEGLTAAAAWQCVCAVDAIRQGNHPTAYVSLVGCNQQAVGVQFTRMTVAGP